MSVLVTLASLRALARHRWQIALSVLGIALGVAVVVGIDLAGASSLRGFRLSTEALTGKATHEISAGSAGVPEELFAQLARAHPALAMAPVVESLALAVDEGGVALGPGRTTFTLLGVDLFSEARLRPWLGEGGSAGIWDANLTLLSEPGSCLISAETARSLAVERGATLRLRVGSHFEHVRVVGVIVPEGPRATLALKDLLLVDVATAQELTGLIGRLTRIDLALADDAELAQRISASLPASVSLRSSALRLAGIEELTGAFRLNLRALSLVALLVGMFLVYNTMTFSVVRRRSLIATLRTLGVTRARIFRVIAAEALWLGVIGTALGVWLGTVIARVLLGLVSQTMNDLYFASTVREVHLDGEILLRSVALGIGATVIGALAPALEATGERPRLGLAVSTLESARKSWITRLALLGSLAICAALALFALPAFGLEASFVGLLLLVLGIGCWAPWFTVRCARIFAPIAGRILGMFGRHAARGIEAQLSRTSVAIAAMAVALSATIGMGVMIDSFRSTFVKWLELSLEGDVYVAAPTLEPGHNRSTIDPKWVEQLTSAPGVAGFSTYRGFATHSAGRPVQGAAVSVNAERESAFEFSDARAEEVWPEFVAGDTVIVSESFGYRAQLGRGERISLETDRGVREFLILGTYADFASEQGYVLLSRDTYGRWFDDRGVTSLALQAEPGVDPDALVAQLRASLPAEQALLVRSNRSIRESSLEVFERTFAVTGVLQIFATLTAAIGVLSALLALELERAREIGMLRALGVTPREVGRLVLAQTGMLGLVAGLLALPLGIAQALVLVLVLNKRSFGWSLDLQVDAWPLLTTLGLSVAAALLAGALPAWRMSRARPALALRGD